VARRDLSLGRVDPPSLRWAPSLARDALNEAGFGTQYGASTPHGFGTCRHYPQRKTRPRPTTPPALRRRRCGDNRSRGRRPRSFSAHQRLEKTVPGSPFPGARCRGQAWLPRSHPHLIENHGCLLVRSRGVGPRGCATETHAPVLPAWRPRETPQDQWNRFGRRRSTRTMSRRCCSRLEFRSNGGRERYSRHQRIP